MTAPAAAHPWETPPTGPLAEAARASTATLPRIETARLVLRAPRIGDFPASADIVLSKRGFDVGQTREDARLEFNQMVAGRLLRGTGVLAIDHRDGTLAGFVLVHQEYGDPEMELGWMLTADAEGQGYATEAARALRGHTADLGLSGLVRCIDAANVRSARVAERPGACRDRAAEAATGRAAHVCRHPVPA